MVTNNIKKYNEASENVIELIIRQARYYAEDHARFPDAQKMYIEGTPANAFVLNLLLKVNSGDLLPQALCLNNSTTTTFFSHMTIPHQKRALKSTVGLVDDKGKVRKVDFTMLTSAQLNIVYDKKFGEFRTKAQQVQYLADKAKDKPTKAAPKPVAPVALTIPQLFEKLTAALVTSDDLVNGLAPGVIMEAAAKLYAKAVSQ